MIIDYAFYLVSGYLAIMSILGFLLMAVDKHRAKRGAWRIPERTLLAVAILGGGMGSLLGMYTLHHKTRHLKFRIIVPLAAIISLVLIIKMLLVG